MKFVAISDTHCRHHQIKLPKGDVLLHAGDISHRGRKDEVIDFLKWFTKQKFEYKIFIAGNHDFLFEGIKAKELAQLIPEGVTYLFENAITINGITLWGSPYTPWFYNWAFNLPRGKLLAKHWAKMPAETDVLLTHGPPYSILDAVHNERHIGCVDLLKRVEVVKPKVHVFGHVHEGFGKKENNGTKFINVSQMNEEYILVNKPIVFEL
ncbi:MAG: metallophosphoesterase [Chitinophagaceae bacterium]